MTCLRWIRWCILRRFATLLCALFVCLLGLYFEFAAEAKADAGTIVRLGGEIARKWCEVGTAGIDMKPLFDHNDHYDHDDLRPNMVTEVSAVKFRQNLGEMLNQVQYRKDAVVVTKDGKPVAALVDAELFERIRRMRERFDRLSAEFAAGFEGRPEDEVLAEIDAAVEAERHGR
jgi:prevent-host-death family protein